MKVNMNNGYGTTYSFEIVDRIPQHYSVWNIHGIPGHPDLLPLCFCPPGSYEIIPELLRAVRMDPEDCRMLLKASAIGADNLSSAHRLISRKRLSAADRSRIEKAIPILEKYTANH